MFVLCLCVLSVQEELGDWSDSLISQLIGDNHAATMSDEDDCMWFIYHRFWIAFQVWLFVRQCRSAYVCGDYTYMIYTYITSMYVRV